MHAFIGCDSSSNVGTKVSNLTVSMDTSLLERFRIEELSTQMTSNAEKFLLSELKNSKKGIYLNQHVCCSSTRHDHVKRGYLQRTMWLQVPTSVVGNPDPLKFGYETTDVILQISCGSDGLALQANV